MTRLKKKLIAWSSLTRLKMSIVEIFIPRKFHPRETLVLSMFLRRGETSREEFTEQFGNLNSRELPGPDGVHLKLWGISAPKLESNIFFKIGVLPGCCESVTREQHFENALKSDLRSCRWMRNNLHRGEAFQASQNGNICLEKQNYIIWPTIWFLVKALSWSLKLLEGFILKIGKKDLVYIIQVSRRF